ILDLLRAARAQKDHRPSAADRFDVMRAGKDLQSPRRDIARRLPGRHHAARSRHAIPSDEHLSIEGIELAIHRRNPAGKSAGNDCRRHRAVRSARARAAEGGQNAKTETMKRVVIVDDSAAYGDLWSSFMKERYGNEVGVETYSHPYDALPKIDDAIDLLIVDLEMPGMEGKKFGEFAG